MENSITSTRLPHRAQYSVLFSALKHCNWPSCATVVSHLQENLTNLLLLRGETWWNIYPSHWLRDKVVNLELCVCQNTFFPTETFHWSPFTKPFIILMSKHKCAGEGFNMSLKILSVAHFWKISVFICVWFKRADREVQTSPEIKPFFEKRSFIALWVLAAFTLGLIYLKWTRVLKMGKISENTVQCSLECQLCARYIVEKLVCLLIC